jgi:hypothetical protein
MSHGRNDRSSARPQESRSESARFGAEPRLKPTRSTAIQENQIGLQPAQLEEDILCGK